MAKTKKYQMCVITNHTQMSNISITAKTFNELLKEYKLQIEKAQKENESGVSKLYEMTNDYEKYQMHSYAFTDDDATISLQELICKDGYHWT